MKKYNRVFVFNLFCLLKFQLTEKHVKIRFWCIRFNIKRKSFSFFSVFNRFFSVENRFDNLYVRLFSRILIAKLECRDVPYEMLNLKKINFFSLRHLGCKQKIRIKYKNDKKVTVLFFVSRISCFMWENLYKIFKQNPKFNVKVCVIPFSYTGKDEMIKYSLTAYNQLKKQGYDVIKAYDEQNDTYFDIKKNLKPDIVFHNKSWYKHLPKRYRLSNFPKSLNYLVEYGISGAKNPDGHFNLDSHWFCDTYFLPSQIHLNMAKEISKIKGKNCIFLGYPKLDVFFDKNYRAKDVWKKQTKRKKRIIWAPHWLYDAGALYSTSSFAELYAFMLYIAKKYKEEIQFAFKPHPMLYKALQNKPLKGKKWTRKQVDAYYDKWQVLENCQFENDRFEDLFLTSDAMIFDSISFMAEYMVTGKPALFTSCKKSILDFDDFGKKVYSHLYQTNSLKEDIEHFIQDIVLNGNDTKKYERLKFVNSNLRSPTNLNASTNIYNYVIKELGESND